MSTTLCASVTSQTFNNALLAYSTPFPTTFISNNHVSICSIVFSHTTLTSLHPIKTEHAIIVTHTSQFAIHHLHRSPDRLSNTSPSLTYFDTSNLGSTILHTLVDKLEILCSASILCHSSALRCDSLLHTKHHKQQAISNIVVPENAFILERVIGDDFSWSLLLELFIEYGHMVYTYHLFDKMSQPVFQLWSSPLLYSKRIFTSSYFVANKGATVPLFLTDFHHSGLLKAVEFVVPDAFLMRIRFVFTLIPALCPLSVIIECVAYLSSLILCPIAVYVDFLFVTLHVRWARSHMDEIFSLSDLHVHSYICALVDSTEPWYVIKSPLLISYDFSGFATALSLFALILMFNIMPVIVRFSANQFAIFYCAWSIVVCSWIHSSRPFLFSLASISGWCLWHADVTMLHSLLPIPRSEFQAPRGADVDWIHKNKQDHVWMFVHEKM